jgi:hypothetical protein
VGDNHEPIYVHGPAAEIKRNRELADWADFVVLSPQCPAGMRWDSPGVPGAVLELVERAKRTWRVDANRVYLTGLSMGGAGAWRVGEDAHGAVAAIAPVCARGGGSPPAAHKPQGATGWVIGGGNDGPYTEGARKMYAALKAGGVDVLQTEVPDRQHDVWGSYYSSRKFYEFLFLHRRGSPRPTSRPTDEQLLRIAFTAPNSMDAKLGPAFQRFLPYWMLLNCGADGEPGLRESSGGRRDVFVTSPLDGGTPCRLMTTLNVPQGQKTSLDLVVGRHPAGRWQLVVRGNGQELLKKTIGPEEAASGRPPGGAAARRAATSSAATRPVLATQPAEVVWTELHVDLTAFAGGEARMELLNCAAGGPRPTAYWGEVKVNSR